MDGSNDRNRIRTAREIGSDGAQPIRTGLIVNWIGNFGLRG
jgi:hypothetical protein